MIHLLIALALASEPTVSASQLAMPDNSDVLMCFVKDAKKIYDKGQSQYFLVGLQYDTLSPDLKPNVRLHDPNNFFAGNPVSKISRVDDNSIFFRAMRADQSEITLTIIFEKEKALHIAGISTSRSDGMPDQTAMRWVGDCKVGKFNSGSNLMFEGISKAKPTLYRNDDK